ncbi:MAG: hypothetical protein AMJ77_06415 [Dehalococcoidia bacterium SM23_28_2]|nr:MAG: hypothetical protein AMJ77_06415 [Dehalococcoidia bacterium SM23_28_2]
MVTVLALAAACGSDGGGDVQEGEAPPLAESIRVDGDGDTVDDLIEAIPVATPTADPSPEASGLQEQLGDLVLSEDDVPAGFSSMGNMDMGMDFDLMGLPTPQGMAAHMSIFATPEGEDMIVSMVILMEDGTAFEEAFSQIDEMSIEEIQDAFDMVGVYSDVALLDTRELDVSGLGDKAYGLGMTVEMAQMGTMDAEMVFLGEGSLMAMAMTMAMDGGAAVDAVPLAKAMADKIEAVVQ